VAKGTKGFTSEKMSGKMSCRMVQNGALNFDNVFVPDSDRLPKADDFKTASLGSLYIGRIYVIFLALGGTAACIELALDYAQKRYQFDKQIGSF
jgi:alkylation response protein AidB-like acyl-CoA dehydrogenase